MHETVSIGKTSESTSNSKMNAKTSGKMSKTVGVYDYNQAKKSRCCHISNRWCRGEIFPFAFRVAMSSATFAFVWQYLNSEGHFGEAMKVTRLNGSVFTAFSTLVSFVVVFRTGQAHDRFSKGVSFIYLLISDWTDAASSLIAFSYEAVPEDALIFRHTVVRLISLLNALMLAELAVDEDWVETRAFELELLDIEGLDRKSLHILRNTHKKTEIVFHWLQCYVVKSIPTGLDGIPAPILSRAFQMLGNGMQHFHQCQQLAQVPWPFPYTQTTEVLLIIHWLITPICMGAWTNSMLWGTVFTFIQVFICWSLNGIAIELENPFDEGQEDVDLASIQKSLNETLLTLVHPASNEPPSGKICEEFFGEKVGVPTDRKSIMSLMHVMSSEDDYLDSGESDTGSPTTGRRSSKKSGFSFQDDCVEVAIDSERGLQEHETMSDVGSAPSRESKYSLRRPDRLSRRERHAGRREVIDPHGNSAIVPAITVPPSAPLDIAVGISEEMHVNASLAPLSRWRPDRPDRLSRLERHAGRPEVVDPHNNSAIVPAIVVPSSGAPAAGDRGNARRETSSFGESVCETSVML